MHDTISFLVQTAPNWRETWPFGPGYAEGWLSTTLKYLFIALIFALICAFLRWSFGPGGFLREKHWDEPGGLCDDDDEACRRKAKDKAEDKAKGKS